MIITLAIVAQVSVSRNLLLLRCGDVELNPGPVGRYPGKNSNDYMIILPEAGQGHF